MSGDTLPFPGGDFPRPFGVPSVAGPESAAEHLRNALMLCNEAEQLRHWLAIYSVPDASLWEARMTELAGTIAAVRRRVAAALAAVEGK